MKMESGSKWRQNPSDVSDESDKGGSGKRAGSISQTGSWRRGMSAQVGVTTPRTKHTTVTSGPGVMKTHGTGGWALFTSAETLENTKSFPTRLLNSDLVIFV